MLQTALCLLVLAATAFGQTTAPQLDAFKKEAAGLQAAVNDAVNSSVPGHLLLQTSKATYLDGFGVVVSLEVAFEPPHNPFTNPKKPEEVRKLVSERRAAVQKKLEAFVMERAPMLASVGSTESLALVVHIFNASPVDVPNLPAQLVFTVKKQDPTRVILREY